MEEAIKKECEEVLQGKTCDIFEDQCSKLQKDCQIKLKTERKHDGQKQEEIEKCESEKCIKLGDQGELHIKEALDAFYPDFSKDLANKVTNGTYFVRQFGMDVNHLDNGGSEDASVTWTGNIDKSCLSISGSYPGGTESYKIYHDASPAILACHNQIFQDDPYIRIARVARGDSDVDRCRPVVTVSQKQPLMLANVHNGKIIKKDGTVTSTTHHSCKEFFDDDNRIIDCVGKGKDCNICRESIWDFTGEIDVYAGGCSLL